MRKFYIGAAIIWSGIWLIAGVLNTMDAIRIHDDLSRTLGAQALIDYWSGYWLVFLHVGALVWGLPVIVGLLIASMDRQLTEAGRSDNVVLPYRN
jgi:hypothetical protein